MRTFALLLMSSFVFAPAAAQGISAPPLDYVPVPGGFTLPAGMNFGSVSGVAVGSNGHIFVLHRGASPLLEFDADGQFVRGLGEGLFDRPHGLRVDAEDNIWVTDVGSHYVVKFSPEGRILLVLGVKGNPGEWHPYRHLPLFNEPSDVAVGPRGDIYVSQGHGKADSRILKFDRDGNFIRAWGKKGKGPGEFDIPHSIVIDKAGLLYVTDRVNQRIQVFDADGNFVRERAYPGTPCGLFITPDQHIWMAHGHAGQVLKLDLEGNILGVMGRQGKALGQFGEAHNIAVTARDEILVADTLNWRLQKFVRAKVQ
jgi:DNA-binding beta-propeller fold protein YncE